ncbi:MAG TPA: FMN-binding negative transcriptional regulator [Planctomycetes bacterium]|nr:FMN-binding negative transcriptional regulator [Fuerstiella sp.]HIK95756.1 FMN-binding negative transcriptional regulator [Planctomycetota bacterium]
MYTPPSFVVDDLEALHNFIQAHSFGVLTSVHDKTPTASHLPLLLERNSGQQGTLVGHMARENPQWKTAADTEVLIIFHGPHAYISPSWFGDTNVLPTWNYVAVHVYGTLKIEHDPQRLHDIVRRYVNFYEAEMPAPWELESAEDEFVTQLVAAIVGFTITIDRIEGKSKLNQNHGAERQQNVVNGLRQRDWSGDVEIADLMQRTLDQPPRPPS